MALHNIRLLGAALLDFVFPPQCLACQKALRESNAYMCPSCWQEVLSRSTNGCKRCSNPYVGAVEQCSNCAAWNLVFERAVVLGDFGEAIQQAVHALKFRQQARLGVELGRRMAEMPCFAAILSSVDVLVPVPLHSARQRERGYNQSACIASGLAQVLEKPVRVDLIKRRINTQQQAKLDAQGRRENLQDAFVTSGEIPPHQCIGLVDDVVTTGATLNACALVLQEAGAETIRALALACPYLSD